MCLNLSRVKSGDADPIIDMCLMDGCVPALMGSQLTKLKKGIRGMKFIG